MKNRQNIARRKWGKIFLALAAGLLLLLHILDLRALVLQQITALAIVRSLVEIGLDAGIIFLCLRAEKGNQRAGIPGQWDRDACQNGTEETDLRTHSEAEIVEWFDQAVQNREMEIYLQPQVPLDTGSHIQAEALIRWRKPGVGMIYPNEFIPLLEKNHRIDRLDVYVFEEVCRLVAGWIAQGKPVAEVSINVSRDHLKQVGGKICEEYAQIKEKYQIPDGILKLELTENTMFELHELKAAKEVVDGFRAAGMKVALDDFGFAYSSLILLKEFHLDILKLDRGFFVDENEQSKIIVSSMIQLAHALGITVVAEGIEQEGQVKELAQMQCDYIQGYVFSKPVPAPEFATWMIQHQ